MQSLQTNLYIPTSRQVRKPIITQENTAILFKQRSPKILVFSYRFF